VKHIFNVFIISGVNDCRKQYWRDVRNRNFTIWKNTLWRAEGHNYGQW